MSPRPPADTPPRPLEVAIVGNDAVLDALPAHPLQLAHALLACGFDLVVPVSWGEEVVADYVLREFTARAPGPAIVCACPTVRQRLLAAGDALVPYLLDVVSPMVATARYVRALQPHTLFHVTAIGGCPGEEDPSINTHLGRRELSAALRARGIVVERQPHVFDAVLPPDRRRFLSRPGAFPSAAVIKSHSPSVTLVTIADEEFASEVAEYLLRRIDALIDVAPRLGCRCCGGSDESAKGGMPGGRAEILRHEPPVAATPVIDHGVARSLQLQRPLVTAAGSGPGRSRRGKTTEDTAVTEATEDTEAAEATSVVRLPARPFHHRARGPDDRRRVAVTPLHAVSASAPHVRPTMAGGAPTAVRGTDREPV